MNARLAVGASVAVFTIAAVGVWISAHSALYTLRVIEVANLPEDAPVSAQAVNDLTAVPIGIQSLLTLNLSRVEKNVLSNPWIRKVRLEKRLPETLVVSVQFRDPKAIVQRSDGSMSYVDEDGVIFGPVDATTRRDLPLFLGFKAPKTPDTLKQLRDAVNFTEKWEKAESGRISQISALSWDIDKGYRASLVYRMKGPRKFGRVTLEVGQLSFMSDESTWRVIDGNIDKVLHYLSSQSISAHQIFVGDGKKIVVKTARGS